MKKLLFALLVAPLFLLAACSEQSEPNVEAEQPQVAEPASVDTESSAATGFSYAVLDGDPLVIEEMKDRVLLVNYWAVWCKPCIEEMPELAHFREEHAAIAEVVGYNFDEPDESTLREDVGRLGVEIPVLLEDPRADFNYPLVDALPVTWAIYNGEVAGSLTGPQTGETLLRAVETVLARAQEAAITE